MDKINVNELTSHSVRYNRVVDCFNAFNEEIKGKKSGSMETVELFFLDEINKSLCDIRKLIPQSIEF